MPDATPTSSPRPNDDAFQRLCVAAARTELESSWCADVISNYKTADRLIVAMTFAAYILWLMHRAFTQVLPSDEAADALRSVISDFSTQPWYQAHVFSRIAEEVSKRMPKVLSQPESAGTSIVDLLECANACGYTLTMYPPRANQSMKPTAPLRNHLSVFATIPCRGLSLSR